MHEALDGSLAACIRRLLWRACVLGWHDFLVDNGGMLTSSCRVRPEHYFPVENSHCAEG